MRPSSLPDPVAQGLLLSKSNETISPARRAAFEILRRVELENAYASVLLAALGKPMREDDRALCHELVLGVLRRRLWLDRALEHFAGRSIDQLDLPVTISLRLGLYQLRFLSRIPPPAAVNESVALMRVARLRSAGSFVNAVLRRATREPDYDPAAGVADADEKLALETSHPVWLIRRWIDAFGFAEAAAFAHQHTRAAPTAFRLTARARKQTRAEASIIATLKSAGAEVLPSAIVRGAWRVTGGRRALRELAHDGLIYFQDEASQLVAQLLNPQSGDWVLDVCAAPGSKTTHVAALAPGAVIVAGDLFEHRLHTLRELAKQQDAGVNLIAHDAARALPFADAGFDRVLVDAPCTGTGTLRHNPEIRWRLQPSDIDELAQKQKSILANASAAVRRGGRLIYSTCSVEPEENEDVVRDFLSKHANFHPISLDAPVDLQTESGTIRTWPHRQQTNGFFVAGFEREK